MRNSSYLDSEIATIREDVYLKSSAQGGVFRRQDLVRWGYAPDLAPLLHRRGAWRRLLHGIYVDARYQEAQSVTPQGRHRLECAASLLAYRQEAHIASLSAAVLHDLPISDRLFPTEVHLLRPIGGEIRRRMRKGSDRFPVPGIRVYRHELAISNREVRNGLAMTSRVHAAFMAAAFHDLERAVALLDCAAFQSPNAIKQLRELAEDWGTMTGIGRVRKAIELARAGAQSPLESISRVRLLQLGLPEPILQFEVRDSRGLVGYADMYWEEFNVIGEADGREKYQDRKSLVAEKLREDRIRALGFRVVRWTWEEIVHSPRSVASRITSTATTLEPRTWRNSA